MMDLAFFLIVVFVLMAPIVAVMRKSKSQKISNFLQKLTRDSALLTIESDDSLVKSNEDTTTQYLTYGAHKIRLTCSKDGLKSRFNVHVVIESLRFPDWFQSIIKDHGVVACIVQKQTVSLGGNITYPNPKPLRTYLEHSKKFEPDGLTLIKQHPQINLKMTLNRPAECIENIKQFVDMVAHLHEQLPPSARAFWFNMLEHNDLAHPAYRTALSFTCTVHMDEPRTQTFIDRALRAMPAQNVVDWLVSDPSTHKHLEVAELSAARWLDLATQCQRNDPQGALFQCCISKLRTSFTAGDLHDVHQSHGAILYQIISICMDIPACRGELNRFVPRWLTWCNVPQLILLLDQIHLMAPQPIQISILELLLKSKRLSATQLKQLAQILVLYLEANAALLAEFKWSRLIVSLFAFMDEPELSFVAQCIQEHGHPRIYKMFKDINLASSDQKRARERLLPELESKFQAHHKVGGISLAEAETGALSLTDDEPGQLTQVK